MLFTKPIQDNQNQIKDMRMMNAALHIPKGAGVEHFRTSIGTIDELHRRQPLLSCFLTGVIPEIHTDGIFYHPRRAKWVIWLGGIAGRRSVYDGLVKDLSSDYLLKLQFDPSECLVIDPAEIVYQDVLSLEQPHRVSVLPVKPQYADLIDFNRQGEIVSEVSGDGRLTCKVPLLGVKQLFEWRNRPKVPDYSSYLNIWPSQPNWKAYWVTEAFHRTRDGRVDQKLSNIQTRFFTYDHKNGAIAECKKKSWRLMESESPDVAKDMVYGQPLASWPDLISVEESKVCGCLIYNPPPQNENGANQILHVGLDFGTARSVICVALDGFGQQTFFEYINDLKDQDSFGAIPADLPFSHQGKRLLGDERYNEDGLWNYLGVVTGQKGLDAPSIQSFPRALLLETTLKMAQNPNQLGHLMSFQRDNFVPFNSHSVVTPGRNDQRSNEMSHFLPVSKWQKDRYVNEIEGFFRQVLLLAAAEVWSVYPNTNPTLSCSTPLAFTTELNQQYIEAMERTLAWLSREVFPEGRSLNWNKTTVSESKAAYSAAMIYRNLVDDELTVVADLGGGTLDLSVWFMPAKAQAQGHLSEELLVSDSVYLGANQMSQMLKSFCGNTADDSNIYLVGYGGIKERWGVSDMNWNKFLTALDFWQHLLCAYIARSFVGPYLDRLGRDPRFTKIKTVNILLAGGGWRTFEARKMRPSQLQERIKEDLLRQVGTLGVSFNPKDINIKIHTRLHSSGMDKIAIAGGLHNTRNIGAMADGLLAPNGCNEINVDRKTVPWYQTVDERKIWDGVQLELKNQRFSPSIDGLNDELLSLNDQVLNDISAKMQNIHTIDGRNRKRTFASLVFESILSRIPDYC